VPLGILRSLPLAAVIWPAFLVACLLEMLVFAVADPLRLHWPGGGQAGLSPLAVYSLAFFAFWASCALCGLLVLVLTRSPQQVNDDTA
jgi:hypothetical protein